MITFASIALFFALILCMGVYFAVLPLIINYFGPQLTKKQKLYIGFFLKLPAFLILGYVVRYYMNRL